MERMWTMGQSVKTINFKLPKHMYERFVRIFPGHGERSTFLRKVVAHAINLREEKDHYTNLVKEEVRKDFEDEKR
jgi:hypothetical protein